MQKVRIYMFQSLLRRKLLCLVALLGFLIGVVVHVVASLQIANTIIVWAIWLLGIGLFVVCGPMVLSEIFVDPCPSIKSRPWEKFARSLPLWTHYIGGILFIYAVISIAIIAASPNDGVPIEKNGKYFLHDNNISRQISLDDYNYYVARKYKLFTACTNLFYFVAFCYFGLYKTKDIEAPRQ